VGVSASGLDCSREKPLGLAVVLIMTPVENKLTQELRYIYTFMFKLHFIICLESDVFRAIHQVTADSVIVKLMNLMVDLE